MVRKQVGIEHSASLAVSKQQDQKEHKDYKPEDQKQQHIDIDLTPDPATSFNFAQQAQANYSARTLAASYEHGQNLGLQHAHLNNTTTNTPLPYDLYEVASSGSILPTEIPIEDEERLERIFNKLDRDGDGRIDIHDLSAALHEFGLSSVYAEKFLQQSDKDQSGNVGFAEFLHYVREHEKNLVLQFSHLDKNRDGKVDLEELISAFKDLGLDIDLDEARNLLTRMDKDGSLNISFNEWRDFMLLAPSTDIHDLIKFWRHSTTLPRRSRALGNTYVPTPGHCTHASQPSIPTHLSHPPSRKALSSVPFANQPPVILPACVLSRSILPSPERPFFKDRSAQEPEL